ncbi:MAG: hypothetical protein JXL67_13020 [Calditrichaeota bacterium]|nr:hypothetical protein [Calditrichota bacterium]
MPVEPTFSWQESTKPPSGPVNILLKNKSDILYAASSTHGILRSVDNGISWEFSNEGLTDSAVTSLCLDSSNALWAGTADSGLFQYNSDSKTWVRVNFPETRIWILATDPSGNIFAGTSTGFVRSADGGQTWFSLPIHFLKNGIISVLFLSGNMYLAGTFSQGIIKSSDGGINWSPTPLTALTVTGLGTTMLEDILAGTINQGGLISKDNGNTWEQLGNGFGSGSYHFLINSAGYIYSCYPGEGVLRSDNNGINWRQINFNLSERSIIAITMDAEKHLIAAASSGRIFRTNFSSLRQHLPD